MDQEAARLLIRRKLGERRLPHETVTTAWAGPSDGEACDACDRSLRRPS
jgi:hypothetical protein